MALAVGAGAAAGCHLGAVAGRTVLTVWLASDYASAPVFSDLDAQFEREHPGVRVKLVGVPWEDMPTKVKTAVIGGDPPDVAHFHPFALGAQGFAEPLDDLWAHWSARHDFLPGAMEDVAWGGHLYGVPLDINCLVLVYNRRLWRQAGLSPPGPELTFAQLERDAERLTDPADQRYGIGLDDDSWHTFAFVQANGGHLLRTVDGRQIATFTDPKVVDAVRFVSSLATKDHVGPMPATKDRDYDDATALFEQGKVATIYTGPWDFDEIEKNAPGLDFGVAPFPSGDDVGATTLHGSVMGGGGLFVPKGAAHRKLAFEWMQLATSPPYALRLAKEQGRYPARRSEYADPFFRSDPRIRTFIEALPSAHPYRLYAYPQADQAFSDAVKATFYGADPATELARAQRVSQLAIDAVTGQ